MRVLVCIADIISNGLMDKSALITAIFERINALYKAYPEAAHLGLKKPTDQDADLILGIEDAKSLCAEASNWDKRIMERLFRQIDRNFTGDKREEINANSWPLWGLYKWTMTANDIFFPYSAYAVVSTPYATKLRTVISPIILRYITAHPEQYAIINVWPGEKEYAAEI